MDSNTPAWLAHLAKFHHGVGSEGLYWPAAALSRYWSRHFMWPTRVQLLQNVRTSFVRIDDLENCLDTLDTVYALRRGELSGKKEAVCEHDPRGEVCGVPVFAFITRNSRGPATIRYGLNPFSDGIARRALQIGLPDGQTPVWGGVSMEVKRGVRSPRSLEPWEIEHLKGSYSRSLGAGAADLKPEKPDLTAEGFPAS